MGAAVFVVVGDRVLCSYVGAVLGDCVARVEGRGGERGGE